MSQHIVFDERWSVVCDWCGTAIIGYRAAWGLVKHKKTCVEPILVGVENGFECYKPRVDWPPPE